MKDLRWRWLLIGAVIAAAIASYQYFGIHQGLDLKGGVHLRMRVNVEEAVRSEMDLVENRLRSLLTDEGIAYESLARTETTQIELTGVSAEDADQAEEVIENRYGNLDVSGLGTGAWRLTMTNLEKNAIEQRAVEQALEKIRGRVDRLGVAEPIIQREGLGGSRLLVQLPGVEDVDSVETLLTTEARLEWKEMTYPVGLEGRFQPPGSEEVLVGLFGGTIPEDTRVHVEELTDDLGAVIGRRYWPLKKASPISGSDLENAQTGRGDFQEPVVIFQLTADAGRRFGRITSRNVGKVMAIVLDDRVLSAPVIQEQIFDSGRIMGNFTEDSAQRLAFLLRSGALPASVEILERRSVGPSLGADSIQQGFAAALTGMALVMVFMVIYYKLSGINAIVALVLNVGLLFGVMAYLGATLTLPGVAGVILTVGMAVDANVLIFERIREEVSLGKTVRSSVEGGFGKALTTILDANVTTLIAALFLFGYGTGPIKGFAVTLSVGILCSMFTAIFVSRTIFQSLLRGRAPKTLSI